MEIPIFGFSAFCRGGHLEMPQGGAVYPTIISLTLIIVIL